MTYLLLQTFLLLLSAYFLGAFLACLAKRMVIHRAEIAAAAPGASLAPAVARTHDVAPLAKPRAIDPVQPRIDILPRPEPKAAPAQAAVDTSRFDRALTGPDPNAGMPRKMIVEIRPAILKSPTGPAQVLKPKVVAAAPKPVEQAKPSPAPVAAEPAKPAAPVPAVAQPVVASGAAAASAAAAAAVAAAKAAAANAATPVVKPAVETPVVAPPAAAPKVTPPPTPTPAAQLAEPQSTKPEAKADAKTEESKTEAKPAPLAPAASASKAAELAPGAQTAGPQGAIAVSQSAAGGDDLQRIRAIDADTEKRLHGIGVRRFDDIAHWTVADINRVNQTLGLTGRIDREQWIEQAQILAKGGETYYSRNRAAARTSDVPVAQAAAPQQPASASKPAAATATSAAPVAAPSAAATLAPQAAKPTTATTSAPSQPASVPAMPMIASAGAAAATAAAAAAAASIATGASAVQKPSAVVQPPAAVPPAPLKAPEATPVLVPEPKAQATIAAVAAAAPQGRSVAEMAAAAAAAIAAASASVTRGIRPIEPISPMSRANPNVSMPARLSDAIKDKEAKPAATAEAAKKDLSGLKSVKSETLRPARDLAKSDDLKRIRGVGVLIEKRLNALGVTSYSDIANWTSGDIDRISQTLDFKGRIERENWVEQARILSNGGHTEFSRRVDRGDVESSRDPEES